MFWSSQIFNIIHVRI